MNGRDDVLACAVMAWRHTCVSSRIHYTHLDLCYHFLICGYGIFPPLRHTIFIHGLCPRKTCAFFSSSFVSTLQRRFFRTILLCLHNVSCPFSFYLHPGLNSFSSCIHVGLDLFLVWPNLNHISNNLYHGMHKILNIVPQNVIINYNVKYLTKLNVCSNIAGLK